MELLFLKHDSIDQDRWDACVEKAANGLPYAYSWYLNCMAPGWHAIVEADYRAVFPLPWNRKWVLFPQIYQPFFCQQLGVFSQAPLTEEEIETFLDKIPERYRRILLHLNEENPLPAAWQRFAQPRTNMLLDLQPGYEILQKDYSKSLRKRIRRTSGKLVLTEAPISPSQLVMFYQQELGEKVELPARIFLRFTFAMQAAIRKQKGQIWAAEDTKGQILAAGFFLHSHQRLINLFGASTERGKELHAMHFLLDALIRQRAGQAWTFDFEGSSIPSIKYFFGSFGAREVIFWQLRRGLRL